MCSFVYFFIIFNPTAVLHTYEPKHTFLVNVTLCPHVNYSVRLLIECNSDCNVTEVLY